MTKIIMSSGQLVSVTKYLDRIQRRERFERRVQQIGRALTRSEFWAEVWHAGRVGATLAWYGISAAFAEHYPYGRATQNMREFRERYVYLDGETEADDRCPECGSQACARATDPDGECIYYGVGQR